MSEYTKEQMDFLNEIYESPFSHIPSVVAVSESLDTLSITLDNPTPQELIEVSSKLAAVVGEYEYKHKAGSDTVIFSYDKRYGTIYTVVFPIGHRLDYEIDNDFTRNNPFELN